MAALFYMQFYIPFAEIQVQQTASPCCMLVQLAYFLRGGSLHTSFAALARPWMSLNLQLHKLQAIACCGHLKMNSGFAAPG